MRLSFALAVAMLLSARTFAAEDYRTMSPAGPPPHRAVLLVPGCSGFTALDGVNIYEERAAELRAAGYFVVFVDYLGPFGNCGHLSHAQVGRAVLDAAEWTRSQADVDANAISVIGWSYGAGGVLAALKAMPPGPPILTRAVMYYPDCRGEVGWTASGITAVMFLGADDDVARPARCDAASQAAPPNSLRVVVYPNTYHAFDVHGLPQRAEYPFGTLGYNAEAAAASWRIVVELLK